MNHLRSFKPGPIALGMALLMAALGTYSAAQSEPAKADPVARVGVFDRTRILVAYYRSDIHDRSLRALTAKRDAAKERGDVVEVKRLEAEGGALQDIAHQQLAGAAELTNVIEALRPAFAEVGKAANVALIVEKPLWSAAGVELVDVTDALAAKLPPAVKK